MSDVSPLQRAGRAEAEEEWGRRRSSP